MMNRLLTTIGDFIFELQWEQSKFHSFFSTFSPVIDRNADSAHLKIIIRSDYGVPFVDYNVKMEKTNKSMTYERADYLIQVDSQYRSAVISVYDELALKHALMNLCSAFLVHHNWGLLLHSSCAVEGEKAHLFAGHSGAGKSTCAKLSQPRNLLSDEASIVKVEEGNVMVYNSPFRSELEGDKCNLSYPLASIQLLHQAAANDRLILKKSDALLHLVDKVFFWPQHSGEVSVIMELLNQLVQTVPVYDLHFQKNDTFWELIS